MFRQKIVPFFLRNYWKYETTAYSKEQSDRERVCRLIFLRWQFHLNFQDTFKEFAKEAGFNIFNGVLCVRAIWLEVLLLTVITGEEKKILNGWKQSETEQ